MSHIYSYDFRHNEKRRSSLPLPPRGLMGQLLEGVTGETLESGVNRLFKQCEYQIDKAERGIVLLDSMDSLGQHGSLNQEESSLLTKEIFGEELTFLSNHLIEILIRISRLWIWFKILIFRFDRRHRSRSSPSKEVQLFHFGNVWKTRSGDNDAQHFEHVFHLLRSQWKLSQ